ncbi:MAG TPA: alpha/beta hydrolase-fold protein [Steroidobacteraceae bacterium]|nr:alpha/beta hydrolase-fold protein [Steroidobacteraceae bacterium]
MVRGYDKGSSAQSARPGPVAASIRAPRTDIGDTPRAAGTVSPSTVGTVVIRNAPAPRPRSAHLPHGYDRSTKRYSVLYMLHGRGDNLTAWSRVIDLLDQMIAAGKMPPVIAIMPDAPWSQRASYYVDSQYAGGPSRGGPVESAFINDLIPHVDVTYRTIADRSGRAIVGYSMGGYGAIRYSLAHPDLFGAAIVLSPAAYTPLPPRDSSARDFGAFGKGNTLFNDDIYQALNYPSLLESFEATRLQLAMFIAVGDDEAKNPLAEDQYKDIDMEAHLLFTRVSRVRGISAELRVYDGGHDWKVWRRGFSEGMRVIGKRLSAPIVN